MSKAEEGPAAASLSGDIGSERGANYGHPRKPWA